MISDLGNNGGSASASGLQRLSKAQVAKMAGSGVKPVYSVDFESYYDDECSILTVGGWHYNRHPKSDIYLVSIAGPEGEFVGHPCDFDWTSINGAIWISHNAGFDTSVHEALKEKYPKFNFGSPSEWHCSSDMAAYLSVGRSLKEACAALMGVKLSKTTRDNMKGKVWSEMTPEFQEEVRKYALSDAWLCLELWVRFSGRFPEKERRMSLMTRMMGWEGVYTDLPRAEKALADLKVLMWECEQAIPWANTKDEKGKEVKLLSAKVLAQHCAQVGIEPPKSLAKDSEELEVWLEKYGETYPWVKAMSNWRRYNTMAEKFNAMVVRTRPDGRMGYELKYSGAHTLRWSGGGGVNMQNLMRAPWYIDLGGQMITDEERLAIIKKSLKETQQLPSFVRSEIDMRRCIIAPPGKKFGVFDLSQIEPRNLKWLTGDRKFLALVATGMSPYEAHARTSMGWDGGDLKVAGETDAVAQRLYQLAKARVLALGYGAGWQKFFGMALSYGVPATIFDESLPPGTLVEFEEYLASLENKNGFKIFSSADEVMKRRYANSWLIVNDFRDNNTDIVALWNTLNDDFKRSKGRDYFIELPCGRQLRYRDVQSMGGWTAVIPKNGRFVRERQYGGRLAENCITADTDVLTDKGWKKIVNVTTDDKLWDGVSWVSHDGVVSRGEQDTIDFGGVQITSDHVVFTTSGELPAGKASHQEAVQFMKEQAILPKRINLVGEKYGPLTVVAFAGSDKRKRSWVIKCDFCGNESVKVGNELRKRKFSSCGCLRGKLISQANSTHGMSRHPVFAVWRSMCDRCHLPSHQAYHNYGARGITVCDRWKGSFENFWADVGGTYKKGLTLDRIDNNRGYEPGNFRWVTMEVQCNNKRTNKLINTPVGRMTISQAAREYGIKPGALYHRVKAGWSDSDLLRRTK